MAYDSETLRKILAMSDDKEKTNKLGMTPIHVAQSDFMEAMAEEGFIDSTECLKPENAKYIQKLLDKFCERVIAAHNPEQMKKES